MAVELSLGSDRGQRQTVGSDWVVKEADDSLLVPLKIVVEEPVDNKACDGG